MQVIIKASRQGCPDSRDLLEVRHPRTHYALQTAKVLEQLTPLGRPKAGHHFEHRFVVTLRTLTSMARDGKAVRLIANALHEPRRWRMRLGYPRRRSTEYEEPLLSGFAVRSLRHADERDVPEAQGLERFMYLPNLA